MRPPKSDYPNILIVEGQDDKHAIIGLMKSHVRWPENAAEWPVFIEVGKSADEILAKGYLSAEIKARNVKALGVMLDADEGANNRYDRLRHLCGALFPSLPRQTTADGVVVANDGKRFGAWLMPDNMSPGTIENFLRFLVPQPQERVWQHACNSVSSARSMQARCREPHIPKANLYTWLAWQDPPGQSPGLALTRQILDPQGPHAEGFVRWFKNLYQL